MTTTSHLANASTAKLQPTNLCHYTTQKGLMGILESRQLWATDVRYLNDSQEFVYATDLAIKYLNDHPLKSSDDTRKAFAQRALDMLDRKAVAALTTPTFVTSFSEDDDLLSQWRGYCPSGSGFAICFAFDRIDELANANGWQLDKCIYTEDDQTDFLTRCERFAMANPMDLAKFGTDKSKQSAVVFVAQLARNGLSLKHPKFKEEREWRAFISDMTLDINKPDTISLREGKSSLIPYIGFPLTLYNQELMQIDSLVISPTPDKELATTAAQYLLDSKKIGSTQIQHSQIPYRHW